MKKGVKTFSQKPADVTRVWYIIDAKDVPLGRVASKAANALIGKDKPTYTPHVDGGDYVVVINAEHVGVTGNKRSDKVYYRHSGYPGSLKERTLEEQLERDATKVIENAVSGMLPKNKLQKERMARLRTFKDAEHEHGAQQPIELKVKG